MKLKTRLLMPLFAVLMLGMATSAFADLKCDATAILAATPGPAPRAIVNGHWENPADIQFACTPVGTANPANPTTDTSITVYFAGLTIVNTTAIPAGHTITVANTAGALGAILDTTRADTGTPAVSNGGSLVAITIPAQAVPAAGTFVLQNVLLSLNGGTTVGGSVTASINFINPSGNTILSSGANTVIIGSVQQALNSTSAPPALVASVVGQAVAPAQFTAAGTTAQPTPSCPALSACANARSAFAVTVTEDHNDSWRAPATYYSNGIGVSANGTSVLYTFSGMLPGSQISNCVLTPSNATQVWTLTGSGIAGTNGTTTLVAEAVTVPLPSIQSSLDSLTLACGTSVANPGYLVAGSTGSATTPITVDMRPFPTGVALPGMGGTPATTGGAPRYNATGGVVGPVTVVQFGASAVGQTTMLIPYALANVGTYDTGVAIANTTKDPVFGTDAQGFAAPDTSGSVSFNFFPGDGSANFTITPTTGFNLVNGQIPAGNSFIGTLSSILKSDNRTAGFQGYIIVVCNFTHAHATAYVYGGTSADRLTSATDVLVIANPLGTNRNPVSFPVAPSGPVGVEPTSK